MRRYTSCARSDASALARIRLRKNACKAPPCSANSRSTRDGLGSTTDITTQFHLPSHVYECRRGKLATKTSCLCDALPVPHPADPPGRNSVVAVWRPRPSYSLNRLNAHTNFPNDTFFRRLT